MTEFEIGAGDHPLDQIINVLKRRASIHLSQEAREKVILCRKYLEDILARNEKPIYGVNTGFGALCDTKISRETIRELQVNLVLSHACGVGKPVDVELSRTMLLLKIINLSKGHSAIRLETLERMIWMYNNNVFPVIPEQGSLGASGDLSPLAHLSLPLIGRGEVQTPAGAMTGQELLESSGLKPIDLHAKEGLALLNGTQFMGAFLVQIMAQAEDLFKKGNLITALSLDAFDCLDSPYLAPVHHIRPHPGQKETAATILSHLEGSEIQKQEKKHVQDPYSFRCVPQVHGASRDAMNYVRGVIEREINGVSDNPLVFPEEDLILSAGNFHGQPLALALDFLAIALAEMASISERRTYKLLSGQRGLPVFLAKDPGLHSGFMIPQYTAASLVSQNKQLCTPASVDTIDSSNGQEDHVSMGANAALKCMKVLENYRNVMAIELFTAAQAMDFRRPLKSSVKMEEMLSAYRKKVPFLSADAEMHVLIARSADFLQEIS